MKNVFTMVAVASALALGSAWSTPLSAQSLDQPEKGASQSFSPDEIKTFAVASLDVERIGEQYQEKMQDSAPDQHSEIAIEAEEEMMQSVEEKGLSVERYNSIVHAARTDKTLARQILELRSLQTPR